MFHDDLLTCPGRFLSRTIAQRLIGALILTQTTRNAVLLRSQGWSMAAKGRKHQLTYPE